MVDELEEHVVYRMQRGDETAFRKVLDHQLPQLMAYTTRLTGSVSDAEDIVQETFMRLWAKRESYDPQKAKLSTWLHRIAHNQFIDRYRKRVHEGRDVSDHLPHSEGPDNNLESADRNHAVGLALMQLDERQRSALVLTHYQGLAHKDVAAILEISVDALESMLRRSRRKMKDILVKS